MDIEADAVSVTMDGRRIIDQASLVCKAGDMTALVGPSGSGKTTLLHCLGLLLRPTAGRVLVNGVDTTGWKAGRRRHFWQDAAAFVLQDYGVMDEESVAFNVSMKASVMGSRTLGDRQLIDEVLDLTGLTGRNDEPAAHLSGGEKQRLSIARAMYKNAGAVFVDEPTASLDQVNRTRVIELMTTLKERGCVVVVSTHDAEMIKACDLRYPVNQEEQSA